MPDAEMNNWCAAADSGKPILAALPASSTSPKSLTSAVDIFVKDLGLVLDAGKAAKIGLPLSAAAHQLFISASGMGLGGRDDSQVIATYRALGNKKKGA